MRPPGDGQFLLETDGERERETLEGKTPGKTVDIETEQ